MKFVRKRVKSAFRVYFGFGRKYLFRVYLRNPWSRLLTTLHLSAPPPPPGENTWGEMVRNPNWNLDVKKLAQVTGKKKSFTGPTDPDFVLGEVFSFPFLFLFFFFFFFLLKSCKSVIFHQNLLILSENFWK